MSAERKAPVRCAVYTRKSSEEGLEQSFNSLDAQREACHAYIMSQRQEGWRAIDAQYDDGGYSGGTMERPGVRRLFDDIRGGKVDVIVVYKVDRLTRSLADFAKMIEILDANKASFVSITQQFNTTSSMGRLTLNVLLSFAQFEREVAGERIRDKIAASKRKGMWMGGTVPLGYDIRDRKLIINSAEAATVRKIYGLYLEVGCVAKLKAQLGKREIKSKIRVSKAGRKSGGFSYSRGALYELLKNRVYLGEITHRGSSYPGQHEGIISKDVWDKVQAQLSNNNDARRNGVKARHPSLLAGLIHDEHGNRFTPSHSVKDGKRYRYYVSQAAIQHLSNAGKAPVRLPAQEVEAAILARLQAFLVKDQEVVELLVFDSDDASTTQTLLAAAQRMAKTLETAPSSDMCRFVRAVVRGVVVREASIEVKLGKEATRAALARGWLKAQDPATVIIDSTAYEETLVLNIEGRVRRCGGEVRLILEGAGDHEPARPVPAMIKAVARGHEWYEQIVEGKSLGGRAIAATTGLDERYVSVIIRCAFLAPDIVEAILDGRQPPTFTLAKITSRPSMNWAEQRRRLGFPARM
jgi:DNA invertase Pin-like site-specific DNA recombinase